MKRLAKLWLVARIRGKPLILSHSGDADGILSASIALRKFGDAEVELAEPYEIQRGGFFNLYNLIRWDIAADLPCPKRAKLWVDHHKTNKPCGRRYVYDPSAPCAAVLVLKALGLEDDEVAGMFAQIAVQTDTANIRDKVAWKVYDAVKGSNHDGRLLLVKLFAKQGLKALEHPTVQKFMENGRSRRENSEKAALRIPEGTVPFIYIDKHGLVFARMMLWHLQLRGFKLMFTVRRVSPREWSISIGRGDDSIDCSEIAEKLGGGGHSAAAGATVKAKTPMEVKRMIEKIIGEELTLFKVSELLKA